MKGKIQQIDELGNYYGDLCILKTEEDKYYASVENWDGFDWIEISEEFYLAVKKEFRLE